MSILRKYKRAAAKAGLIGALALGAGVVGAPAFAAGDGPVTNGCWGRWYNTGWDQRCGSGATASGYYKSTADCTAPQINDIVMEKYRQKGSAYVYAGTDCAYGINIVRTYYSTS